MSDVAKIIMGTGRYEDLKSGNVVSISGDGGSSVGFSGPAYRRLSPLYEPTFAPYAEKRKKLREIKDDISRAKEYYELKKQMEYEYIKSFYETRLKKLDIEKMLNYLEKTYGTHIIFACYEPVDEFCHRRLVPDYIELKTGVYIPEVISDENGNVKKLQPIRYKKILQEVMNK